RTFHNQAYTKAGDSSSEVAGSVSSPSWWTFRRFEDSRATLEKPSHFQGSRVRCCRHLPLAFGPPGRCAGTAGGYPTTFWIDNNGTITDYEVGFASSKRLEDRIAKVLAR